jgi:hypothetical protein
MRFEDMHPEVTSVRIHNSSRGVWVGVFSVIAVFAIILVVVDFVENGLVDVPLWSMFLLVTLLCLCRAARDGVELTADGIVVRKLGKRVVPWSDITAIDVRHVGGMRQAQVVEHDTHVRNLPAPSDRWPLREEHFDEKLEVLRRYWKACR